MGNNTLRSLIVAAGIITAGSHAEGTSNKVDETKRAIQELISSLDASKYGAARGVLGGDEVLLADSDISPQDTDTIRLHANKLLPIAPAQAQAVLDALNGNGGANNGEQGDAQAQVEASPAPVTKKLPPLNETKEAKVTRLALEKKLNDMDKMAQNINKSFFDIKGWKSTVKTTKIHKTQNGMKIDINNDKAIKREDTCLTASPIIDGNYQVDINYSGEGSIGFWAYDSAERIIQIKAGEDRTFLANGTNNITLPEGVKSIRFGIFTSPSGPFVEVSKFNINTIDGK